MARTGEQRRPRIARVGAGDRRGPGRGRHRSAGSHVRRTRPRSRSAGAPWSCASWDAATPTTTSSITVPGTDVVLAGDLLENGAVPFFGDGYPLDWPATAAALAPLVEPTGIVVPGHGDHAGRRLRAAAGGVVHGRSPTWRGGSRAVRSRSSERRRSIRSRAPRRRGPTRHRAGGRPTRGTTDRRAGASRLPGPDDPATARGPGDDPVERLIERVERDLRRVVAERRAGGGPWPGDPRCGGAVRSAR